MMPQSRFTALLLSVGTLFGTACATGPEAQFHYASTGSWVADHPTGQGNASSPTWSAPASAGQMLTLTRNEPIHLHANREQWIFFLAGHGNLFVGPEGAGFSATSAMVRYPISAGDVFLIPRQTAHSFQGVASFFLIHSPGLLPDETDFVEP